MLDFVADEFGRFFWHGRKISVCWFRYSSSHWVLFFLSILTGKASTSSLEKMNAMPLVALSAVLMLLCQWIFFEFIFCCCAVNVGELSTMW